MPADQRAEVFARIREALSIGPAPHRHGYNPAASPETAPLPSPSTFKQWLPSVGETLDERIALLAQNAVNLRADFRSVDSEEEAARQLAQLAAENRWQKIAAHGQPGVLRLAQKLALPLLLTDPGYASIDLETCDASLTGCDAVVAQTGSVLVSAASAGGRALSVLLPHHIIIARRSQLVPDLSSALALARQIYAPNWPSMLSFITGPSRTADIERILVLGAHGPKKLTIFLLPDSGA